MMRKLIGGVVVCTLLGWWGWSVFLSETKEESVKTADANIAKQKNDSSALADKGIAPLVAVGQQKAVFIKRSTDLMRRAGELSSSAWRVLPNDVAYSAFQIQLNADQSLVVDENLKNYFEYYLFVLGAVVGEAEGVSRLNKVLNSLPMPAQAQAKALFAQYVTVQYALQALNDLYAPKLQAIARQLDSVDAGNRQNVLFQSYQASQKLLNDKEQLIMQLGGETVKKMYQSSNDRNRREITEALILTDPATNETSKIEKIFAMYELSPNQAMDDPAGKVRFVYTMLDTALIKNNSKMSEAQKQIMRERYFGSAYMTDS